MVRDGAAATRKLDAATAHDNASGRSGVLRTDRPHVEARLTLHRTEDGGRRGSVFPGYRAHWWVHHPDGACTQNDAPLDLRGIDHLAPGESGDVRILPIAPEYWQDLEVGSTLEMWEGRVVGIATVTRLRL